VSDCRAAAARVLAKVIAGGAALDTPLREALEETRDGNRALLRELCYGSLRHFDRLDGILRQLLEKPLGRKDTDIRALLLIGLYQLEHMRVPDYATVSTTVEACRALRKPWSTGLVNGVLRRFPRERDRLLSRLNAAQAAAHPRWLHESIRAAWPDRATEIFAANNSYPPLCLRVNRRALSREEYRSALEEAGLPATLCETGEDGVRLEAPVDVGRLPGFSSGAVSVQDEAAQLAAQLLDAQPDERILDACAAPGGKACHILERQPALRELVALDSDATRLARVEENLARLNLTAAVRQMDASDPAGLAPESFDRILVDAPCSGSGVIRRHPDIKLLRKAADIERFAARQMDILRGTWPLLRPGGRLVYATCSIFPAENVGVVDGFLSNEVSARLVPLDTAWGIDCDGCRQLLPRRDGPDGLFYAVLRKNA